MNTKYATEDCNTYMPPVSQLPLDDASVAHNPDAPAPRMYTVQDAASNLLKSSKQRFVLDAACVQVPGLTHALCDACCSQSERLRNVECT